ncbi:MAG: 50S ribosomal protein L30 [Spirochaetes bacterium]|nr:50S ribosomal protein L30 [Spirochaetota bacterium]
MAGRIKIKLVRSTIGKKPYQRRTVKALGLGKINSSVEKEANPAILGMVKAVEHLVVVEEIK